MGSTHDSYQALGIITFIFAVFSTMGAGWIMYSACKMRQMITPGLRTENSPIFLTNHVLWMSFCDALQQSWIAFTWLSPAINGSFLSGWSKGSCTALGVYAQFFLVGSAAWNFVIALCLLRIIGSLWVDNLKAEIPYHHLFCWGTAFICTLPPLINGHYGYTPNIEVHYDFEDYECWISNSHYQLCLYGPVMAFVFSALILLCYTFYKEYSGGFRSSVMTFRLTLYTVVFVVTWIFPIILRLRASITTKPPSPFLVWMHHIGLSLIGIGNAIIWGTSEAIKENRGTNSKGSKSSKDKKKNTMEMSSGTGTGSVISPPSGALPPNESEDHKSTKTSEDIPEIAGVPALKIVLTSPSGNDFAYGNMPETKKMQE